MEKEYKAVEKACYKSDALLEKFEHKCELIMQKLEVLAERGNYAQFLNELEKLWDLWKDSGYELYYNAFLNWKRLDALNKQLTKLDEKAHGETGK